MTQHQHTTEPPDVFPWWNQEQAPATPQRVVPSRARRHTKPQYQGWAPQTSSAPDPVKLGFAVQLPPIDSKILLAILIPFLLLVGAVMGVVGIVALALLTG